MHKGNPLHGQFVVERLKQAREAAGGQLAWGVVAEIVQKAHDQDVAGLAALYGAPKTPRKQPVPRKRNEFVDALAEACGGHPQTMTKSAIRAVAIAWAEIHAVSPDCTPDELKRRAERYRSIHPTWPCTAGAIAKHWDSLGVSLGRTESAKHDAYIPPPDWLNKAQQLYPEADFTGREWAGIPITIRAEILRRTRA